MITIDQARGLLARAVLTQGPDFVYSPSNGLCSYLPRSESSSDGIDDPDPLEPDHPKTKTGCLIGVALSLAGETRQQANNGFSGSVRDLSIKHRDMMDSKTIPYFEIAQKAQDNGATWGEAYEKAEVNFLQGWLSA